MDKYSNPGQLNNSRKGRILFNIFFFLFGFAVNFIHNMFSSATQDILEGTNTSSSLIIILLNAPYILVALLLPYFIHRITPFIFALSSFVFLEVSTGLSVFSENNLQFLGLALVSVATGIAEVGFLSSSFFNLETAVHLYSFGAGAGFCGGPLLYTAMTSWLCISPTTTLSSMLCLPPIVFIFHCYIARNQGEANCEKMSSGSAAAYTRLPDRNTEYNAHDTKNNYHEWTIRDRLYVFWRGLPLLMALFIGDFSETVILQSVATTLIFPNSPFDARTHYVYYVTASSFGELVGRSQRAITSSCNSNVTVFAARTYTWILPGVLVFDLFFLIFAAWYRFLPNVWIVLSLMLVAGLCEGVLFGHTFTDVPSGLNPQQIEFYRGLLTVAYGSGILVGGFVGLSTEAGLKKRCLEGGTSAKYCIARSMDSWSRSNCSI